MRLGHPHTVSFYNLRKGKPITALYHFLCENTANSNKNFDDYNIKSGNLMEDHPSVLSECITTISDMSFACPCGKEYRSYPALFTHIKNKHNGKAPGNIKKPSLPSKRRGRPPISKPINPLLPQVSAKPETDSTQFMTLQSISQIQKEVTPSACIASIVRTLLSLPFEHLNKTRLNQITSFIQMNVYLASEKTAQFSLHIGCILTQFLHQLSSSLSWSHFQQVYTLLMLLVQNGEIISNGPIDLLCDYINNFLQIGVLPMAEYFQIGHLSIFKVESMLDIFDAFFQWIMVKKYTNYRIKLNGNCKKMELQGVL